MKTKHKLGHANPITSYVSYFIMYTSHSPQKQHQCILDNVHSVLQDDALFFSTH